MVRLLVVLVMATAFVAIMPIFHAEAGSNLDKAKRFIAAVDVEANKPTRDGMEGLLNAVEAEERGDSQALEKFICEPAMPAVSSTPVPMASPTVSKARALPRPERASVPTRPQEIETQPTVPNPPVVPKVAEPRETRTAAASVLPVPVSVPAKADEKPIVNKTPLPNPTAINPQPPVKQPVVEKSPPKREVKEARYLFDKRGPEEVRQLSRRYMREGAGGGMIVQDIQDRTREYEVPKAKFFVERYMVPTEDLLNESESRRLPSSPGYTEK
jgi:hypothetical protein